MYCICFRPIIVVLQIRYVIVGAAKVAIDSNACCHSVCRYGNRVGGSCANQTDGY